MKTFLAASFLALTAATAGAASSETASLDGVKSMEKTAAAVEFAEPTEGDLLEAKSTKLDMPVTESRAGFGVNAGVTTLGATIEPVWRVNDRFGLRMPIGGGSYDYSEDSEGESYEGTMDIGGVGLVADFYPTGRNFHLSAGAFKTNYGAELKGENIDLQGFGTTDITVDIKQKSDIAPFAGFGYDGRIGKHGTISFGAGAIFGQGFDVEARESSGMAPQDMVDDEAADIKDALKDIGVIPYVKLMVGLRF